jgi:hypothetical protein
MFYLKSIVLASSLLMSLVSSEMSTLRHTLYINSGRPTLEPAYGSIFTTHVHIPNATWIRIEIDVLNTDIDEATVLVITSKKDKFQQTFDNIEVLRQWGGKSAYFNGDSVMIELKNQGMYRRCPAQVVITGAVTDDFKQQPRSEQVNAGTVTKFRREGRLMPAGCTAFIINDGNGGMLSSASCLGAQENEALIVQFHVPEPDEQGRISHPRPDHQYPVDLRSIQKASQVKEGEDWMYFGTFKNSNTGKHAYEVQKSRHKLGKSHHMKETFEQMAVTGYTGSLGQRTVEVDKMEGVQVEGFILKDLPHGFNGAALMDTKTQRIVAIYNGNGHATSVTHPELIRALKNPLGVCK